MSGGRGSLVRNFSKTLKFRIERDCVEVSFYQHRSIEAAKDAALNNGWYAPYILGVYDTEEAARQKFDSLQSEIEWRKGYSVPFWSAEVYRLAQSECVGDEDEWEWEWIDLAPWEDEDEEG